MSDHDMSRPRYLAIKITDEGDEWTLDVDVNRIKGTDDDTCAMIAELRTVLDRLHVEAHIERDLAERIN